MNRQQLRDMVKLNLGDRTDKNDLINAVLDMALTRVLSTERWTFANADADLALVEGDTSVVLPDDCGKIMSLTLVDGTQLSTLVEKSLPWFKRFLVTTTDTTNSTPIYCCREGSSLNIYPPANKSYTIRISYSIKNTFTNDASVTPDDSLVEPIIAYATAYLFRSLKLFQEAMVFDNNYAQTLASAIYANRVPGNIEQNSNIGRQPEIADECEENTIFTMQPFNPNSMR